MANAREQLDAAVHWLGLNETELVMKKLIASTLQSVMNSSEASQTMTDMHNFYTHIYLCGSSPFRAEELSDYDLPDSLTFDEVPDISEVSECEFDDRAEYLRFLGNYIPKKQITTDTLLIEVCNYKGEGMGCRLYEDVKNNSVFESR